MTRLPAHCAFWTVSNDRQLQTITLLEGIDQYEFATPLTALEKAWLVDEIDAFLDQEN